MAVVGTKSLSNLDELSGYYGQKVVLAVQMMGLIPAGLQEPMAVENVKPAINQQKFHISLDNGEAIITAGKGPITKIDLGIVKYNFEAVSGHKCR